MDCATPISKLLDDIRDLELQVLMLESRRMRKELALAELMEVLFPVPVASAPTPKAEPKPTPKAEPKPTPYGTREPVVRSPSLRDMVESTLAHINGDVFKPHELRDILVKEWPELRNRSQLVARVATTCRRLVETGVLRKEGTGLYARNVHPQPCPSSQ